MECIASTMLPPHSILLEATLLLPLSLPTAKSRDRVVKIVESVTAMPLFPVCRQLRRKSRLADDVGLRGCGICICDPEVVTELAKLFCQVSCTMDEQPWFVIG